MVTVQSLTLTQAQHSTLSRISARAKVPLGHSLDGSCCTQYGIPTNKRTGFEVQLKGNSAEFR
jgi:hypothetical protein